VTAQLVEIEGRRCLLADADGPVVRDADGARSLIEEAMTQRASVIVEPAARLDGAFFQLRSGIAGEVLQKTANYGFKFAVLGDISAHVRASDALRNFVTECNRGQSIFFGTDLSALTQWPATLRT